MNHYIYSFKDRLKEPENYMYSDFVGIKMFKIYKEDRINRIKKVCSTFSSSSEICKDQLFTIAKEYKDEYLQKFNKKENNVIFLKDEILNLINHLCLNKSNKKKSLVNLLNKIIQRFEVSKFLCETYDQNFKNGKNKIFDVQIYLLFSLVLSLSYLKNENKQYLSTLLKLNDLILSTDLSNIKNKEKILLNALIIMELEYIQNLLIKNNIIL